MHIPKRALSGGVTMLVSTILTTACGSVSATSPPTPTPLPSSLIQQRYLAAADAYNNAENPIAQAENTYCVSGAASANLASCETALGKDRQATITFDSAVRAITFPQSARSDVTKLLNDDAQLEMLLEQASTAPSLSAINALTPQIFQLLRTASSDADKVRADVGLPAVSPSPT